MQYLRSLLACAAILLLANFLAPRVLARSLTAGEHVALAGLLLAEVATVHKVRAKGAGGKWKTCATPPSGDPLKAAHCQSQPSSHAQAGSEEG